jgi:hypothetical protein
VQTFQPFGKQLALDCIKQPSFDLFACWKIFLHVEKEQYQRDWSIQVPPLWSHQSPCARQKHGWKQRTTKLRNNWWRSMEHNGVC